MIWMVCPDVRYILSKIIQQFPDPRGKSLHWPWLLQWFAVGFPNSFMAIFRAPFFSVGSVLIVPILPLMWVPPTFRKFTPQATLRRVYLKMTGSRLAAIDPDALMKLPWFMKINQQMVGLNNRNGGIIGTRWDI